MSSQQLRLEVGARSETGYVREENQDRMSGSQTPLGKLYTVADGMGGHKGGAVAAELTVQGLQQYIGAAQPNAAVNDILQAAFAKTNETVYQQAHSGDPSTEGMGSTAVSVLLSGQVAWVAHVGDSRAYLYRNARLRQLTTDHTVVQKMVQAGILTAEEAMDHPEASRLERAVGHQPSVEVDIIENVLLHDGDAILLCSDGLTGYVVDAEIETVLRGQATVQEIPERLVELALQKGGEDNVTVQFIQYGARQEVKSGKVQALRDPAPVSATKLQRPSWRMAATLVLVVVIAIGVLYEKHLNLRQQLERAEAASAKAAGDAKTWQEKWQTTEDARAKAEENVLRLSGELKAAGDATASTVKEVTKLERRLKTAEDARAKAKDEAKRWQKKSAAYAQELRQLKKAPKETADQKVSKPTEAKGNGGIR